VRNTVMLALLLFIAAPGLWAQAGAPGADTMQAPANGPNTIDGCLQVSGDHFRIVDKTGKSYLLTGSRGKLSHLVGRQVEVTGKPTIKTIDTTEAQAASTVQEIPAFEVKEVKLISKTCSSPPQ